MKAPQAVNFLRYVGIDPNSDAFVYACECGDEFRVKHPSEAELERIGNKHYHKAHTPSFFGQGV